MSYNSPIIYGTSRSIKAFSFDISYSQGELWSIDQDFTFAQSENNVEISTTDVEYLTILVNLTEPPIINNTQILSELHQVEIEYT